MLWLREVDRWFIDRVLPHARMFRAYAYRLTRNAAEADDLVQEAYARILSAADWRLILLPERFVLRTIHNLACDRMRQAHVIEFHDVHALATTPDPAPGPAADVEDRDDLRRLMRLIERLPRQCRKVLLLRRAEGLTPGQIAEKLHISVSTVEKHLAKAVRLLTEMLAHDGAEVGGAREEWARVRSKIERR